MRSPASSIVQCGLLALAAGVFPSGAEPVIARNGVTAAANGIPAHLAQGAVAPGSRVRIKGSFGAGAPEVLVAGQRARIIDHRPDAIEVLLPGGIAAGTHQLQVVSGGRAIVPIQVVPAHFAVYTENGLGWGPAKVGGPGTAVVTLTGTGLGRGGLVQVSVGGKPARILSQQAGADGIDKLTVRLNPATPSGCYVPVLIRQAGLVSNPVTLTVGTCQLPPAFPYAAWPGKRAALVMLSRTVVPKAIPADEIAAVFLKPSKPQDPRGATLAAPAGTCAQHLYANGQEIALSSSFSSLMQSAMVGEGWEIAPELAVIQGRTIQSIPRLPGAPGFYRRRLADDHIGGTPLPMAFDRGEFRITGPNGSGPLQLMIPAPTPFECVNCSQLVEVNVEGDLTAAWAGPMADRQMAVVVSSVDPASLLQGVTFCLASAGAASFTVPAIALAHLPVTSTSRAILSIASWPRQTTPITGLTPAPEVSIALSIYTKSQEIRLKRPTVGR